MTLEDRLERLATRTPASDPDAVLAAARARADSDRPGGRRQPLALAAAAAVAVLALAAAGLAVIAGDSDESVTAAGGDSTSTVDGAWVLAATVRGGERQAARGSAAINVEGDIVTGTDGCGNDLEARLDAGTLSYSGFRTLSGCLDEAANDDAIHFWRILEQNPSYEIRNGELRLMAESGNGLVFTRPSITQTRSITQGRVGRERYSLSRTPGGPNGFCVALRTGDEVIEDSCGLPPDATSNELIAEAGATENSAYVWGRTGTGTVRVEIEIDTNPDDPDEGTQIIQVPESGLVSDLTGRYFVVPVPNGTLIGTLRSLDADGAVLDTWAFNSVRCPCD